MGVCGASRLSTTMLAITAAVLCLSGCVGTISRADFAIEIDRRGGGLSEVFFADALAGLATGLDQPLDQIHATSLSFDPPSDTMTATVVLTGSAPALDRVLVQDGDVRRVDPVIDVDEDDLASAFSLAGLAATGPAGLLTMTDDALAAFGVPGARVDSILVGAIDGQPIVLHSITSPRQTASALFTIDGQLIEVRS